MYSGIPKEALLKEVRAFLTTPKPEPVKDPKSPMRYHWSSDNFCDLTLDPVNEGIGGKVLNSFPLYKVHCVSFCSLLLTHGTTTHVDHHCSLLSPLRTYAATAHCSNYHCSPMPPLLMLATSANTYYHGSLLPHATTAQSCHHCSRMPPLHTHTMPPLLKHATTAPSFHHCSIMPPLLSSRMPPLLSTHATTVLSCHHSSPCHHSPISRLHCSLIRPLLTHATTAHSCHHR